MVIRALLLMAAMAVTPAAAQMRVVGSDDTAKFVPLEVGKSIVIDLPEAVADVMIAQPNIANVVMRTNTRAFVMALSVGDTSIFFFDAKKQRIDALDIAVRTQSAQMPHPLEPKTVVTVVRQNEIRSLDCTRTTDLGDGARCYEPLRP